MPNLHATERQPSDEQLIAGAKGGGSRGASPRRTARRYLSPRRLRGCAPNKSSRSSRPWRNRSERRRSEARYSATGCNASICWHHLRIPYDFPQVLIRIEKVSGVTSVKGLLSRLDDRCAGTARLLHHSIDFLSRGNVVSYGERRWGWSRNSETRVARNTLAHPQSKPQARLKVEECDSPELKLFANDSIRPQPQAISIESKGSIQIIDTDGYDVDSWFHAALRSGNCIQAAQRRKQNAANRFRSSGADHAGG